MHHVTLTTGHSRRSWREEVAPDALRAAAELLGTALHARSGAGAEIPGLTPACRLTATAEGRCLICTIWGPADDDGRPVPVVTLGVATHARCGARLWPMLHDHSARPLPTRRDARAPEPWCAVRLDPGALLYQPPHDLLPAIADLERCLAWAWIEGRR